MVKKIMVDTGVLRRCWEIDKERDRETKEQKYKSETLQEREARKLEELRATWSKIKAHTQDLARILKSIEDSYM